MNYLIAPESIIGSVLFLILGFGFLIKGGDALIDGSVNLAKRFKIPMAFIGLTIVACGTSAPELFTTTYASMNGKYDLAMSNVLGSNIFNVCIILGLAGLFFPFTVNRINFIWDWTWLASITTLLILFSWDLEIKTYEAFLLFLIYIIFVLSTWKKLKRAPDDLDNFLPDTTALKDSIFIILGLIGLLIGTRLAIKGGVQIGALLGLTDRFIGLLILAIGTSLPEMVTSLTAAYKGHAEIAIANVMGANIANILIVLGFSGTLNTFQISEKVFNPDIFISLIATLILGGLIYFGKFKFPRWQGLTLILTYISYFYFFVI